MDAISFVLGVRSAALRSAALKDLIYRSGSSGKGKGKGKEKAEDAEEGEDEDEDEDGEPEMDEEGERDGERKAWVLAVYIDSEEKEWRFQRR
jgi:structural maintenance of chromosome 1